MLTTAIPDNVLQIYALCSAIGFSSNSWATCYYASFSYKPQKSRLQFETVNKQMLMLTTVIPDSGLKLYLKSYAARSAITATAERLVNLETSPRHRARQ